MTTTAVHPPALRHPLRRLVAGLLLVLLLPAVALAHAHLEHATPGGGAHLSTAPRELRFTFSEAIELAIAEVALLAPDGQPVALGALMHPADSARVMVAPITGPLVAGPYTVRWQAVSRDGHPVRGAYEFVILPGAAGLAAEPHDAAPAAAAQAVELGARAAPVPPPTTRFDASSPLYAAVRWLDFVALVGVLGAVAFRLLVLPRAARRLPATGGVLAEAAARRAATLGLLFAALSAVAALLRLYAQSYALHGAARVFDAELVGTMLVRTLWGWAWLLQAAATVLALVGFAAARRRGIGWGLAGVAALALAVTPTLSGHAAATPRLALLAVPADALHVLGAGGWVGSLAALLLAGVPAARRLGTSERGQAVAALVNAFSPTALGFAALVVVTGALAAWLHLGSLAALWASGYGRTLLLKLAAVAVLVAAGAYNWRVVRPALGSDAATGRLRRSAGFELGVALVVLAVTAVLVATMPGK
ncbi:MAG TPA: copper resistance protein CopC [Longimicrobiaceae bacterium]|nr:copper resistance protein CopC [Longimicrobiaceae bacterium]